MSTDRPKLVYVSHPYRATDAPSVIRNINDAENYGRKLLSAGYVPIVPHSITPGLFGLETRDEETITAYHRALMDVCDELHVCGKHISDGMQVEIDYCNEAKKPILFHSTINVI